MNKRDRKNLAFLMQGDTPALRQWYSTATEDCKEYAMELLMGKAGKMRLVRQTPSSPSVPVTLH
jgi:hypothetical protein